MLEAQGIPVGVVTAIRGAAACPVLSLHRRLHALGRRAARIPQRRRNGDGRARARARPRMGARARAGGDLVFTVGKLFTDPRHHALTKVPGRGGIHVSTSAATTKRRSSAWRAVAAARARHRREPARALRAGPVLAAASCRDGCRFRAASPGGLRGARHTVRWRSRAAPATTRRTSRTRDSAPR